MMVDWVWGIVCFECGAFPSELHFLVDPSKQWHSECQAIIQSTRRWDRHHGMMTPGSQNLIFEDMCDWSYS